MSIRSLKEAVAPILWVNCIFCMGIFEIPVNRPRFLFSVFYVVLILSGYCILFYKGIFIFQEKFTYEFIIFYFVLAVNILVAALAIILFWYKSENLNNILKKCNLVDNTLEALGIKRDYRKLFRSLLFFMSLWLTGLVVLNAMHIVWMYNDTGFLHTLYTDVCFCLPLMINSVVDLTFVSLIRCVKVKFQNTNILISDVIFCANKSSTCKIREHSTPITLVSTTYKHRNDKILHLIQTLRHLHLEITRISQQINEAFCVQLLLEMAVHFTVVIGTSYSLYGAFSRNTYLINNGKIIAMIVWGSIYSIKIILINCLCTSVAAEAYKTGEIIQSFEGCVIDDDIKEEIHQFTQQILLNSLNFTAAGFFSINNTLTGKFFATVSTYVVILIQMNPVHSLT